MQASKVFLFQLVVVACLIGFVLSASLAENEIEQPEGGRMCKMLCEACQQAAEYVKQGLPMAKEQLKQLCSSCGAQENQDKCRQAIDKFADKVEKESPLELCKEIGFCKKPDFLKFIGF